MDIIRYNKTRDKLIKYYEQINHNLYYMFFPPAAKMTLDQLEHVETRRFTDIVETDFVQRPVLQKITIRDMIGIIPNLSEPKMMGYRQPRDAIDIYETVQDYLSLWCDIIIETPEFNHPPIHELYKLETVAQWSYTQYANEYYRKREQSGKLRAESDAHGILALIDNLGLSLSKRDEELSFVSHLDNRLPKELQLSKDYEIESLMGWGDPTIGNGFNL